MNSYISHDKYILANNVLREYYGMKEEIKNPETSSEYAMKKEWCQLEKYTAKKNSSVKKLNKTD